ncbi:MAG: hypothetical protein Q7T63_14600 [Burkholderiaceae bacterium]|nr:hypothetical protein [Burkholderiaceae bacterium]MDP3139660.1 hypothetical protein [Burkholderiaceae bacterium]
MMYEIIKAEDQPVRLNTMGEVLWELNGNGRYGHSPYKGDALHQVEVWKTDGNCFALRANTNHVGIAVDPAEDAAALLVTWVHELRPYATRADGTVKPPHEMRRAHWGALNMIGKTCYNVLPCFSGDQLRGPYMASGKSVDLVGLMSNLFQSTFGYSHNGPAYDAAGQQNSRHEVHVAAALARGAYVPQEVIQEYLELDASFASDLQALKPLLNKPYLRGKFRSMSLLQIVLSVLRDTVALDEAMADRLAVLLKGFHDGASYVAVDDTLYDAGIIGQRPALALPSPESLGTPLNAFAVKLRDHLVAWKRRKELADLEMNCKRMALTKRETDWQRARIAQLDKTEGYAWANRVAQALLDKNLPFLLDVLDGTMNEASQRAVEAEFGVKLRNVKSAERRRAVFSLVGLVTDQEVEKAEQELEDARVKRMDAREARREQERKATRVEATRARAANVSYSLEGKIITGAEFVDILFARGYTEIRTSKRGAAPAYYLQNPTTGSGFKMKRGDGTLNYAQALIERRDDAQASPATQIATA